MVSEHAFTKSELVRGDTLVFRLFDHLLHSIEDQPFEEFSCRVDYTQRSIRRWSRCSCFALGVVLQHHQSYQLVRNAVQPWACMCMCVCVRVRVRVRVRARVCVYMCNAFVRGITRYWTEVSSISLADI